MVVAAQQMRAFHVFIAVDDALQMAAHTWGCTMRTDTSKLAPLAIAYHARFGLHVPRLALRLIGPRELADLLQDSLDTGVPLSEAGWYLDKYVFSPGGCCRFGGNAKREKPKKSPDGDWLQ